MRRRKISHGASDANQLLSESYSGGTLNGLTVTSGYDSLLRRNSLSLNTQPSTLNHSFGYDSQSGRLESVSDGTHSATYSYLANSPLVSQITYKQSTTTRMTTTKQYDKLNRLLSINSVSSVSSVANFQYQYNSANQRYRVTLADGSYWFYEYDSLGQLRSGKKFWSDGTPVAGQQFEYSHDDIGNRTQAKSGGDQTGAILRTATYNANSLNQYTSRTIPNAVVSVCAIIDGESEAENDGRWWRWHPRRAVNGSSAGGPVPRPPGIYRFGLLQQGKRRKGGPFPARPPCCSQASRSALGSLPSVALSSAGAKGVFPVSVSLGGHRAGNRKRQFELIAFRVMADFTAVDKLA